MCPRLVYSPFAGFKNSLICLLFPLCVGLASECLCIALASECYKDKPQMEVHKMNGCNMSEPPHFGSDGLTYVSLHVAVCRLAYKLEKLIDQSIAVTNV